MFYGICTIEQTRKHYARSLTEIIKRLNSSLMVCRYCDCTGWALLWCTIMSSARSISLPVSQHGWQPNHVAMVTISASIYTHLVLSKRSQQVVRPRGTGKVQMLGHIMWRRASQQSVWPSMFVYPHRSSYQCPACTELCIVRNTCNAFSWISQTKAQQSNIVWTLKN